MGVCIHDVVDRLDVGDGNEVGGFRGRTETLRESACEESSIQTICLDHGSVYFTFDLWSTCCISSGVQ
jgi:hypothetical protein